MNHLKQLTIILVLLSYISAGVPVRSPGKDLSTFEWTVVSPPSSEHKSAIDHCVSIIQKTWVSKLPVTVRFKFKGGQFGNGFIAKAMPQDYMKIDDYKYPSALGKSMFSNSTELDAAVASKKIAFDYPRYDLKVEFEKDVDWYAGIDGKTPRGKTDLVSLCLHEVYHGLMFSGSDFLVDDKGTVLALSKNDIFDTFIVTKTADGKYCPLKSFYNNREKLTKAVTNNHLYFATQDRRVAKLYAPFKFGRGSSVHHLDESKYQQMSNRLMTPNFKKGQSTHEIGPIVEEIRQILRNKTSKLPQVCGSSAVPIEPKKPLSVTEIVIIIVSCAFGSALFVFMVLYFLSRWYLRNIS